MFDGVNKTNCELIVPEGSVAYKQAKVWNEFSNIRDFAGENLSALETEKETIPQDVVVYSEDYKKLVDATALKDKYYEIDERVEEICGEAFKCCDKLEEIVMPKKLKKIDSYAFLGCSSLTKLTLPDSVTSIGKGAFQGCGGLTELTLPIRLKKIWNNAFFVCSSLTKLTLPDSVKSIGKEAFWGCRGLTE